MSLNVEDRAQIHDLHARYAHAFDAGDGDALAALFTADGQFVPPGADPLVGTEALRGFVSARTSDAPGMRHLVVNIVVDAEGDGARGSAYFLAFRLGGDGQLRLRNLGRYDDRFVRAGDGWRIARREIVGDVPVDLLDAPFAFGPR